MPPADQLRLKVVVRHIPPHLPEDVFWKDVSAWISDATVSYRAYKRGHISRSRNKDLSFARAYVRFKSLELMAAFHAAYDGHVFVDAKGREFRVLVEFAPYQAVPNYIVKKDTKVGTIEQDSGYRAFLSSLKSPEVDKSTPVNNDTSTVEELTGEPSGSTTAAKAPPGVSSIERLENRILSVMANEAKAASIKPKTTPLLDFLRKKKERQQQIQLQQQQLQQKQQAANLNSKKRLAATSKSRGTISQTTTSATISAQTSPATSKLTSTTGIANKSVNGSVSHQKNGSDSVSKASRGQTQRRERDQRRKQERKSTLNTITSTSTIQLSQTAKILPTSETEKIISSTPKSVTSSLTNSLNSNTIDQNTYTAPQSLKQNNITSRKLKQQGKNGTSHSPSTSRQNKSTPFHQQMTQKQPQMQIAPKILMRPQQFTPQVSEQARIASRNDQLKNDSSSSTVSNSETSPSANKQFLVNNMARLEAYMFGASAPTKERSGATTTSANHHHHHDNSHGRDGDRDSNNRERGRGRGVRGRSRGGQTTIV